MIPIASFITLAAACMVVASPLKPAIAVSLSRRQDPTEIQQIKFVDDAAKEAAELAQGAVAYINAHGGSTAPFTTYFGRQQDPTEQLNIFKQAAGEHDFGLHIADTGGACARHQKTAAFGAYEIGADIFFCPSFYNQVNTGSLCRQRTIYQGGIRSGTTLVLILEAISHLRGSLSSPDCRSAINLASTNPGLARKNAMNYSCFAMQAFINTVCN